MSYPPKSAWVKSTPVSMMPTFTPVPINPVFCQVVRAWVNSSVVVDAGVTGVKAVTATTSGRAANSAAACAVVETANPGMTFFVLYSTAASGSECRASADTVATCELIALADSVAAAFAAALPLPRSSLKVAATLVPVSST